MRLTERSSRFRVFVPSWLRFGVGVALGLGVVLLFSPTFSYPFLNWDDGEVFVRNAALHADGFVRWAFTTTYMEHYQPLAWLAWGVVDRAWTLTPAAAHALNVGLHVLCAALVFVLARRLTATTATAIAAALLFAMHPLRVEVVAWASAMPYALALLFALLSLLVFLPGDGLCPCSTAIVLGAVSAVARPGMS
jgi:protein O-mannosyl-transferase